MKTKKCKICWKEFTQYSSLDKFCSIKCKKENDKLKKQKIKEKKRLSVSVLTKVADTLWSKIIKERAFNTCEYCWKTTYLNSHHLFTRARRNTRWDLDNWICLCSACHTLSSNFSAHKCPIEFTKRIENLKWKEFIEELSKKSQINIKVNSEYLLDKIKELKSIK